MVVTTGYEETSLEGERAGSTSHKLIVDILLCVIIFRFVNPVYFMVSSACRKNLPPTALQLRFDEN
jgi:hypothetical protein